MRRSKNSVRTKKFILRNSLEYENVREYVSNLIINIFGFKDFTFNFDDKNTVSLKLSFGGQDYLLYLDKEDITLHLSAKGKTILKSPNDSCWYQSLKYIKENSY